MHNPTMQSIGGPTSLRLLLRRHPVQSGDAIWMAPYVPQWFAALGTGPSDYARYILYKDLSLSTFT